MPNYFFPRSFHAYKSTNNDSKGFCWKDLPSWKCEILHVIFTTMHKNSEKAYLENGGVYRNHPVRPSIHVPCKRNSSQTAYWIFMKLYIFVIHYLQMCMKEYGCCPKFKRGDNSTYTFTKRGGMYLVSATPTKLLVEFLWNFTQL